MTNTALSVPERRTAADIVFDQVYDQIITLELLPGAKVSEAEIAEQFGVSRQPVRQAFDRLANMGLLQIQPQRATRVQKFSHQSISTARFVRLAIELEIFRSAAIQWNAKHSAAVEKLITKQEKAVAKQNAKSFHVLDEAFHQLVASVAGLPHIFELVLQHKAQVDRICVLSLKQSHEMQELVTDHKHLLKQLQSNDQVALEQCLREHFSRIETTLDKVSKTHAHYFAQ